ncbi:MAG: PP2C family protein-serine/threonine phosphatase, partial [Candidatus Eisenbacteria bacterium]|nr:PP2C family protein-serine/threonine phosphatase [Candidatus Eisenbacteria bacterium]
LSRGLGDVYKRQRESLTRMLERDDLERISAFGPDIPGQRIVLRAAGATRALGPALPSAPDSLLAVEASSSDYPLLFDGRTIFLRARIDTVLEGQKIRAEALAPIDSLWMSGVSEIVGARIRLSPQVTVMREGGGVRISEEDDAKTTRPERGRSVGPRETDSSRLPGGAIIPALRLAGDGFRLSSIPVTSSADFTEPLLALIPIARENPIATMALIVLGLLAVLLLGAIWVTVVMVIGMARSITGAVRALTDGTQALRAGHFEHRIPIDGNDELWAVARSFNEMAEDLEKSRDIERESQRLEEELRLARLIQNRLLPSGPPDLERVELAGISMPAREVGGDYFDYLVLDNGLVGIAVADVSGKGAPAALLMSSFRASLRTQDLAGLGPAEVLARLNRFIHQSVDPGKFITAFLGLLDPATGRIRYANAGHDPPLVRKTTGEIVEMTGGGLILGMLPQIVYEEGEATLERGSLLAVFTDGVTEARNVDGDFFGSDRLAEFLRLADGTPCSDILQGIVERVQDFSEGTPQADDITIVLMRPR